MGLADFAHFSFLGLLILAVLLTLFLKIIVKVGECSLKDFSALVPLEK